MWRAIGTWWKYFGAKLNVLHDERADPKVQLEQALTEARAQHRRLTEQAASVIANQQQVQRRLDRAVAAFERADASARQALLLADREARSGGEQRAAGLLRAAESLAGRSVAIEEEVREIEQQLLQATQAAASAKVAVAHNAEALRRRLADREKLLSTLDQAKMQEQVNAAMQQISGTVGDQVPTLEEVQRKIEARLARAQGMAELAAAGADSVDVHLLEIEQAQLSAGAQARLAEMRVSLGLAPATAELVRFDRKELER